MVKQFTAFFAALVAMHVCETQSASTVILFLLGVVLIFTLTDALSAFARKARGAGAPKGGRG